jgi:hypothetical protein
VRGSLPTPREARNFFAERGPHAPALGQPGNGYATLTGRFVDQQGHPTRQALDRIPGFLGQRLR